MIDTAVKSSLNVDKGDIYFNVSCWPVSFKKRLIFGSLIIASSLSLKCYDFYIFINFLGLLFSEIIKLAEHATLSQFSITILTAFTFRYWLFVSFGIV